MIYHLRPHVVFEVGVGKTQVRSSRYWGNAECHLFEPNPDSFQWLSALKDQEGNPNNVFLHNVAISDRDGEAMLNMYGDCSFVEGVSSPIRQNNNTDQYPQIPVPTQTIDHFDKGNIDILYLDTEGSEWLCLEKLISRPLIVVVETHDGDGKGNNYYHNKHLKEILDWMRINDYVKFLENQSDSFFIKRFAARMIEKPNEMFI